jgi:hypothetical protein
VIPVAELLRRLETSRTRILTEVEGVDETRFARAPQPGAWSVGQVLEHIARIDDSVAAGTRRVVAGPPGPPLRWHDHVMQLPYRLDILDGVRVRTAKALDPETAPPRAAGCPIRSSVACAWTTCSRSSPGTRNATAGRSCASSRRRRDAGGVCDEVQDHRRGRSAAE